MNFALNFLTHVLQCLPNEREEILERKRELAHQHSSLARDGIEPLDIFCSRDSDSQLETVSEMSEHSMVKLVGEKGTSAQ